LKTEVQEDRINKQATGDKSKYAILKDTIDVKSSLKILVSVAKITAALEPGDIVTLVNVVASEYSFTKDGVKQVSYFFNASTIQKRGSVSSVHLLYALNHCHLRNTTFFKLTPEQIEKADIIKYDNDRPYVFKVCGDALSTDFVARELAIEDSSIVKLHDDSLKDPKIWFFEDKLNNAKHHIAFRPKYIASQWKGEYIGDDTKIKIDVNAFGSSLYSFRIRDCGSWKSIAAANMKFVNHTFFGYLNIKESHKMGVNFNEDSDNALFEFGLNLATNMIIFDMPQFLEDFGIPVTDEWVKEAFQSGITNKSKSTRDAEDNIFICLNEYSVDIDTFIKNNKGKVSYRVITSAPVSANWKPVIKRLTPEEGVLLLNRDQRFETCAICVSETDLKYVYALFNSELITLRTQPEKYMYKVFNVLDENTDKGESSEQQKLTNSNDNNNDNNNNNNTNAIHDIDDISSLDTSSTNISSQNIDDDIEDSDKEKEKRKQKSTKQAPKQVQHDATPPKKMQPQKRQNTSDVGATKQLEKKTKTT
jgi:hypothetical protein